MCVCAPYLKPEVKRKTFHGLNNKTNLKKHERIFLQDKIKVRSRRRRRKKEEEAKK